MPQLLLWGDEKPPSIPENFVECIHYDGSREIFSTLSPEWKAGLGDRTVWSAGFVRREKYEEYLKKKAKTDARNESA